jgi:threonine dehydratase
MAARRIEGRVLRTPLRRSEWLSRESGKDVHLKLETLQPTFSYKIRGAWNAILALAERRESPTLVTASAGNHGRALAYAARASGMDLRVYVPAAAPAVKIDAIRLLGVDVRLSSDYDAAERDAKEDARRTGSEYVSPYSHPDVIAGAGTIALEIMQDLPRTDLIVVPVGGGGLISGIALVVDGKAAVLGVEAAASSPFARSLAAGRVVPITVMPTLADGLAGNLDPDTITFDIVRRLVGEMTTVSEAEIRTALRSIAVEERVIAEGAAATAVAAVSGGQLGRPAADSQTVAVVLSGANVDAGKLREII